MESVEPDDEAHSAKSFDDLTEAEQYRALGWQVPQGVAGEDAESIRAAMIARHEADATAEPTDEQWDAMAAAHQPA